MTLHLVPEVLVPLGEMASVFETLALSTPALPASVDFAAFTAQTLFVRPGGSAHLTGPTGTVVLD